MADDRRDHSIDPTRPARSSMTAAMGDEVSPVELLFDLVFVFAISQLSHHLLNHLTWRGALETAVLLMAVFGIWSLTSFGASMPGITRRAETGILLVVLVVGLFFNAGISRAFEDAPWLFAVPFLVCNIGIVFFYLLARSSLMRQHAVSMLVWVIPSTALWITGALAEPETRLWWWLVAAVMDLTGAWSAHRLPGRRFRTIEVPFAPAHMIERSRLFLIIALGETGPDHRPARWPAPRSTRPRSSPACWPCWARSRCGRCTSLGRTGWSPSTPRAPVTRCRRHGSPSTARSSARPV